MTMFGVLTIAVRIYQDRWGYGIYSGPIGSAVFIITVKWVSGFCVSVVCLFGSISVSSHWSLPFSLYPSSSTSVNTFFLFLCNCCPLLWTPIPYFLCALLSVTFYFLFPSVVPSLSPYHQINQPLYLNFVYLFFGCHCLFSSTRWSSWGRCIQRRQCTHSRSVQAAASALSLWCFVSILRWQSLKLILSPNITTYQRIFCPLFSLCLQLFQMSVCLVTYLYMENINIIEWNHPKYEVLLFLTAGVGLRLCPQLLPSVTGCVLHPAAAKEESLCRDRTKCC